MTSSDKALALPLRPVSTVDAAAAALRAAIANGQFPPGSRIKEIPASNALGLSRGPIRDALRLLAEEGLVQIRPNIGATVAPVHAGDLMEIYAIRLMLGTLAIRHAVKIGLDDAAVIAELGTLHKAARHRDVDAAVDADLGLQDALVRASGLARTARLFERTTVQLRVYAGIVGVNYKPLLPAIYDEDSALIEAVRNGRVKEALKAWRAKLETWLRTFTAHLGEEFDRQDWQTMLDQTRPD